MAVQIIIFIVALATLLYSAQRFTDAAEKIGTWLGMPSFVIGVFIVGIGTSLPELISSTIAVTKDVSEIVPGNIIGASISNILLITGIVAWINGKDIILSRNYIFIDLHFLVGALLFFSFTAFDGQIMWQEAWVGIAAFLVYSRYLIHESGHPERKKNQTNLPFPTKPMIILVLAGVGIYLGANYTVSSISNIATSLQIPASIIALTVLSLGTTLPELAVNISAIRSGKAEMAVGNVLGSCIFNMMVVPGVASLFGTISVPATLIGFSLPFLLASGLLFYLVTQDKTLSKWEGLLFILLFLLFILKVAGIA